MEFIKYTIIFILLYNLESIICALTSLITESINYLIGRIAIDLQLKQQEAGLNKEELEPCIGFQAPEIIQEEDYD